MRMRKRAAENIVRYYVGIPYMLKALKGERDALEASYMALGGMKMDGMPHSSMPGRPTEILAVKQAENGTAKRIEELTVRIKTLEEDARELREILDLINSKYRCLIGLRYECGYSWAKIAIKMNTCDSTVRSWHKKALERVYESVSELPMARELVMRASRAR